MVTRFAVVLAAFLAATPSVQTQKPPPGFQDLLRTGDVQALTAALDKDPALTNQRDRQGAQPIFWAAVYGQRAIVDLLLARGADPRSSSPLGTAVHGAVIGGDPEILRALAARGADVNGGGEDRLPPLVPVLHEQPRRPGRHLLGPGASDRSTPAGGPAIELSPAS
jgi:ankyrin repeat protein